MTDVTKMSDRTADTLFGTGGRSVGELGELFGLVRRISDRMAKVSVPDAMGFAARGVVPAEVEPTDLPYPTDFTMPMPVWEEADFTVPPAPASAL